MDTTNSFPYYFQNQGASYQQLSSLNFQLAVVDKDDIQLSSAQLNSLESSGKMVMSYLSIGEAENYRNYWQQSWNGNPPSFVLGENPNWPGNYAVKFWDPAWQNIMINKAESIAKLGYDGMYLDVVDVYTTPQVIKAYGSESGARQAMIDFVITLSEHVKAINPNFKVVQNNALDLISIDANHPDTPNSSYLEHIDGVGAESTWTVGNNAASWAAWNLQFLETAAKAGKTVLVIDYPTSESVQQAFIDKATAAGFVPFIGNQALNGSIDDTNYAIHLSPDALDALLGGGDAPSAPHTPSQPSEPSQPTAPSTPSTPVEPSEPTTSPSGDMREVIGRDASEHLYGRAGSDIISGRGGNDVIHGYNGDDQIQGDAGNDTLYGGDGHDTMSGNSGSDKLYGGTGNDHMEGNAGSDVLYGQNGNDVLYGNEGNDTLAGGKGDDILYGGKGQDVFIFSKGSGNDIIHDFAPHNKAAGMRDIVAVSHIIYHSAEEVLQHTSYHSGNAIIDFGNGNQLSITGIAHNGLSVHDIHMV